MLHKLTPLIFVLLTAAVSSASAQTGLDEDALKQKYNAFIESLDHKRIAKDYPKAVQKLDSTDSKEQIAAIKTLAATGEVEAIPWIVPFIDSEDGHARIYAGLSLLNVVASHELKRRDMSQSERVVIKPPGPGDLDLKPMAWVIIKMLRKPDDGNTHSYAANMIGYLGLKEFEDEVRGLLKSRHPAVTRAARNALEMLGVEQPNVFSEPELEAAKATGEAFAKLFREKDEDSLGLLLVPREALSQLLSPQVLESKDINSLYAKMVSVNRQRFTEFRSMCGDLSKMSSITFRRILSICFSALRSSSEFTCRPIQLSMSRITGPKYGLLWVGRSNHRSKVAGCDFWAEFDYRFRLAPAAAVIGLKHADPGSGLTAP